MALSCILGQRKLNQKRLTLIVQEFGLAVNTKKNLYASVLDAWTHAMIAVAS